MGERSVAKAVVGGWMCGWGTAEIHQPGQDVCVHSGACTLIGAAALISKIH